MLTFTAFEILHAPLMILDAKTDLADPTQAESKRMFMLAVQGPIVDLHKSLSRLVHQRVRYRAKGIWLDYDQKKSNPIKVHNIARRKLLLQDAHPPFDCASCKGSLHAADFVYLLGLLTANNQWNIGAELGSDPMESAFARTLTAGIKGVAMVLDQEVQPLTRVWCLFEFLLSSRQHLELVFVTNAGVIGDDGCSSFDIALEVGKKIKKDIFEYIISELGSLERMDEQIRALMAEMLMRNLANVEKATGSLVDSLGQGSATDTDATLYEESF
eukprot:s1036_g12.t1